MEKKKLDAYFSPPLPSNLWFRSLDALPQKTITSDSLEYESIKEITNLLIKQAHKLLYNIMPDTTYSLSLVRGSVVNSRLEQARHTWSRIIELFEFSPSIAQFKTQYGEKRTDDVIKEIKKTYAQRLLYDKRREGAGKLLFRKSIPKRSYYAQLSLDEIKYFIEKISIHSSKSDNVVKIVMQQSHLGKAKKNVKVVFIRFLRQFSLPEFEKVLSIENSFTQMVNITSKHRTLHPFLPLKTEAITHIASALQVSALTAEQLIILLRFSWIMSYEHLVPSDIALKCEIVIPTGHQKLGTNKNKTTPTILENALSALIMASETPEIKKQLMHSFPDMNITTKAVICTLPQQLFKLFASSTPREQLTFITKYQMGKDYFKRYIETLSKKYDSLLLQPFDILWTDISRERLVSFEKHTQKNGILKPLDLHYEAMVRQLENTIREPSDENLIACTNVYNPIIKNDRVDSIAGIWEYKTWRLILSIPDSCIKSTF